MIVVVNRSTLVTDDVVQLMVDAVDYQLRTHVASSWSCLPESVVHLGVDSGYTPRPGDGVVTLVNDQDDATELWAARQPGVRHDFVLVRPQLDNGAGLTDGAFPISVAVSHAVIEMQINPTLGLWAAYGAQTVPVEVCDPVEGESYAVMIPARGRVLVSEFVTPSWFDPNAAPLERFSINRIITKPFDRSRTGALVTMANDGSDQTSYGDQYLPWQQNLHVFEFARRARILNVRRGGPSAA